MVWRDQCELRQAIDFRRVSKATEGKLTRSVDGSATSLRGHAGRSIAPKSMFVVDCGANG